ncbi:MAG: hypothetical protein IJ065_02395 [Eubacterium sp.]|nr:hypothetical protein [Eubacterium sp.]
MKKVIILFLAILFLGVAGFFFYRGYIVNEWKYTKNTEGNTLEYAHKSTKEKIST